MSRLIPLGDARARDPEVAGRKAAELARAAAAEMPVLPGWVLPLGESAAALARGSTLAAGSGAAAVLAVSGWELDGGLRDELVVAVRDLGGRVVVRSSSPLERDPRWAGAFATYLDVGEGEIEAAVRGCWASVFARDARSRGELLDVAPAAAGVAVLLQPFVAFASGGVAVSESDGSTRISVAQGPPSDLLAGRASGTSLRLGAPGGPQHDASLDRVGPATVGAVLSLARSVAHELGADAIEWGADDDGGTWLLQVRTAAVAGPEAPVVPAAMARRARRTLPPVADRLANAAASYPGTLGERWVLPWALALDVLPEPARLAVHAAEDAVAEAASLARAIAASAWEVPVDRVADEVAASFRGVLGPDPTPELARLSTIRPPAAGDPARLLGLVVAAGSRLGEEGALSSPDDVWRLTPDQLAQLVRGRRVPVRRGADRWEPFVFAVARDRGRTVAGRAAAPGFAAARATTVDVASESMPPPRRVLVVRQAVPQLAPMLWEAAGLVAAEGNEGAHLFEVARSLGVPAVLGVELDPGIDRVVAVDGDLGTVSTLKSGLARPGLERAAPRPIERLTG
jgi:phosphohistidine swiveling domain-containing protein